MRRIIAVLSVMAIMAAMVVVMAMPAFAGCGIPCGDFGPIDENAAKGLLTALAHGAF